MTKAIEELGEYKLVLGLEIHIQPNTRTKMFCGCDAYKLGIPKNSITCPVCLGMPGALPVPNPKAIEKTQLLGIALNCRLNIETKFDRKHYFYPDLAKGYQISQYEEPFCEHGYLELESGKRISIERIHLEEDTAKSFHHGNKTLIDFNMAGMPLIEIVTDPVFETPEEASEFARKLRDIARFIGVSDADMEKGQMRIEPNISIRTQEMEEKGILPDYKVEIKNINSFKFMEKAVYWEIKRQRALLESGQTIPQENRGWDENKGETVSQRSKEEAKDYRYFPEPDIPPMEFSDDYLEGLKKSLPELPYELKERLQTQYGLNPTTAEEFSRGENISLVSQFEELAENNVEPQKAANLLLNRPEYRNIHPLDFIKLLKESENKLTDEDELTNIVKEVISKNEKAVEDFKNGKDTAVQFLLGQVMKETKGKADPKTTENIIKTELNAN